MQKTAVLTSTSHDE